jgi:uncharacterized short protein YbdD (DUF466 family)
MTAREAVQTARERLARAACVLRTMIGVPDYERYVAHVHAHHPGTEPLTEEEFVRQRLADRYSRPGTRCC